jgi:hypothetical protein
MPTRLKTDRMRFISIILLSVAAAVAYGILHDQITARICLGGIVLCLIVFYRRKRAFVLPLESPPRSETKN